MSDRVARYAEYSAERCVLTEWAPADSGANPTQRTYRLDERPQWLVNAVSIGKVGRYAMVPLSDSAPGPRLVLWFVVTAPPRRLVVQYYSADLTATGD